MIKTCEPNENMDLKITRLNDELDYDIKVDDSFKGIRIIGMEINYLPLNLAEKFPSLEVIMIANSQLKEIHKRELENLTHLKIINLIKNYLQELERNLFEGSPMLEHINLSGNQIKFIHPKAFSDQQSLVLPMLSSLNLDKNFCISKNANSHEKVKELIRGLNVCESEIFRLDSFAESLENKQTSMKQEIEKVEGDLVRVKKEVDATNEQIEQIQIIFEMLQGSLPNLTNQLEITENNTLRFKQEIIEKISTLKNDNRNTDLASNITQKSEEIKKIGNNITNLITKLDLKFEKPPEDLTLATFFKLDKESIFMVISIGQVFLIILILMILLCKIKPREIPAQSPMEDPYATIPRKLNTQDCNQSKMTVLSDNQEFEEFGDYQELSDFTFTRPHFDRGPNENVYSNPICVSEMCEVTLHDEDHDKVQDEGIQKKNDDKVEDGE